jgi:hypothetical protein
MQALYWVLPVLAGANVPANWDVDSIELPPPGAVAPLPASTSVPEPVPTARDKLPARPTSNPWADWSLAVAGATHAPIDLGVLATLETPFRLRLSFGYGWVPPAYSALLTGIAASESGDAQAAAILNHASYQGHTFRGQAGVRPFRSLGLFVDVGLARLSADGSLELAASGIPALRALGGGYRAHTTVDMWLLEVGSQHEFWHTVVLGFAVGVMGTLSSQTDIVSVNGAPTSPLLGQAAGQADAAIKSHGYVPTVTLRLGFDLLAIPHWLSAPSRNG